MVNIAATAVAKINVGLEVLARRADGYHDIRSLFVAVDLADELYVESADILTVQCEPPMTAAAEDNLVYRAARRVLGHPSSHTNGAKITLRKHIPAGAGMGGGSSDAAYTLAILRDAFAPDIDDHTLTTMALELGSDVPFFLEPGVALVEGRGERIRRLSTPFPWAISVVHPGIHVPTSWAYQALAERRAAGADATTRRGSTDVTSIENALKNKALGDIDLTNDFEQVVFPRHPELRTIVDALRAAGAVHAGMSGTGSTIYGLFSTPAHQPTSETIIGYPHRRLCAVHQDMLS